MRLWWRILWKPEHLLESDSAATVPLENSAPADEEPAAPAQAVPPLAHSVTKSAAQTIAPRRRAG
jgi:hypothetical protein